MKEKIILWFKSTSEDVGQLAKDHPKKVGIVFLLGGLTLKLVQSIFGIL